MIRKLKGILDSVDNNSVVIDVMGVGYHVFCSSNTITKLPELGKELSLLIDTQVREDYIHLYGFISTEEKQAFTELTKVNGVGNKMALNVLSAITPYDLKIAISAGDKAVLQRVPGVGPKLAVRIVTELKGKEHAINASETSFGQNTAKSGSSQAKEDAISALVSLGYSRSDAYITINKLTALNDNISLDALIKASLKELTKNSR